MFDTLLQKDDQHILDNLAIRNLATRGYYDTGHHGNYSGLPGHVQDESINIVKQSKSDRDNKDDKTENVDERSAIETEECAKKKLEFEYSEQVDLEEEESENVINNLLDKDADETCADNNASSHCDERDISCTASESEREEKVISSVEDDVSATDNSILSHTEHSPDSECTVDNAHETHSIRNHESSKTEILSKAPCDTGTSVTAEIIHEPQSDILKCNNTENPSSSIVLPVVENVETDKLTDILESQSTESHVGLDGVNTDKGDVSNDSSKLSPVDRPEDDGGVHGVSPRRSRIEVHNIVNW